LWGKHSVLHSDLHVPLMIRHPLMKSPGRHSHAVVELVDVFPTLVELALYSHFYSSTASSTTSNLDSSSSSSPQSIENDDGILLLSQLSHHSHGHGHDSNTSAAAPSIKGGGLGSGDGGGGGGGSGGFGGGRSGGGIGDGNGSGGRLIELDGQSLAEIVMRRPTTRIAVQMRGGDNKVEVEGARNKNGTGISEMQRDGTSFSSSSPTSFSPSTFAWKEVLPAGGKTVALAQFMP
jgi:hypothetical protein